MSGRRRGPWAAVAAGAATFAVLAATAGTRATPGALDAAAHRALYDALGAGQQAAVLAVTWLGNNATLVVAVTLVAAALLVARRPESALRLVVASGGGAFVITGLKLLFSRQRPLEQIIEAHGWSFPSGHAFASTVFYGMLAWLVWRAGAPLAVRALALVAAVLVAGAVGLSRVYLNVHYLSDVAAGWVAGGTWLVLSQLLAGAVWRAAGGQSRQTWSKSRNDADTSSPA